MRLFLDANVIFAAAYSAEGRARALFMIAGVGRCTLIASQHAIAEARRNVTMKAPHATEELEELLRKVQTVAEGGPGLLAWAAGHGLPENDAPILAAAAAAEADVLVTGDRRHFGYLVGTTTGGVRVITLADALDLVLDEFD
ncbi:MAG: PIN domain-containing protein [bacterium]|nr:PIN domain-containing protein [bacterium]